MQVYLVGGAVRDHLLGRPIKEKDWVVVGSTVAEMLAAGFRQVGKDFPVFLHPDTFEEYALARTERKIGKGYHGFIFDTAHTVPLEDDLRRRDLTINAMAMTQDGQLIDPYHGQEDLKAGILRHVSPAFGEDPVRILRLARFAARFNFKVAPETLKLMQVMVAKGEVDALVPERVFKELEGALQETHPENFFSILQSVHAFRILFPELTLHANPLLALNKAVRVCIKSHVRFAAFCHEISPVEAKTLATRLRLPKLYRDLLLLVTMHKGSYLKTDALTAVEWVDTLTALDAFRREQRFLDFLKVSAACFPEKTALWEKYFMAAKNFATRAITENHSSQIKERIRAGRIAVIRDLQASKT